MSRPCLLPNDSLRRASRSPAVLDRRDRRIWPEVALFSGVASLSGRSINSPVRLVARLLAGSALFLFGCGFAHNAGVVVTAPIRLFHHPPSPPVSSAATVTTTTTTSQSAGRAPAHPQPSPVTALSPHRPTRYVSSSSPSPAKPKPTAQAVPKPKSSPAPAAEQNFPTAKPVPEKPGYVFSPSEPGKYVDVSGYPPGSKVKYPYSGKIFLVP